MIGVKEFYNEISQNILINNNFKHYFTNSSFSAVFAEKFNRTKREIPKGSVFEKGDGNWIDVLSIITKRYNIPEHFSTELTPIKANFNKNERSFYQKLIGKRKNKTLTSSKRSRQNRRLKENFL